MASKRNILSLDYQKQWEKSVPAQKLYIIVASVFGTTEFCNVLIVEYCVAKTTLASAANLSKPRITRRESTMVQVEISSSAFINFKANNALNAPTMVDVVLS
jgi:hypothetical protein